MLFILWIPKCSEAAVFATEHSITGIYLAMREDPTGWLTATAKNTGSDTSNPKKIWATGNPVVLPEGECYGQSIVWAIGGSCCRSWFSRHSKRPT